MRSYKKIFLLACAALAVCFSMPVSAASNILNLTNVEVVNKSETAIVDDLDFSSNTLSGDINLKQLNDTITLALTLENVSDTTYKISSISDNLTGGYLIAEYDFNKEEIAPGETTTMSVALGYAQEKEGVNGFKIKDYVISINLLSGNGEAEVVINPGTGDSIVKSIVLAVVISALVITVLVFAKNKRAKIFILAFVLSGIALLPVAIYAEDFNVAEIKISGIILGIKPKTLSSITTMQEMTSDICAASDDGETNTLTDTRENGINRYIVGKAADGQCWMLQNLRLGSSVGIGGNITVDKVSNVTGEVDGVFELSGRVERIFTDTSNNFTNDNSQFTCNDEYGCFYNWTAATAGTGLSDLDSGDASGSICPKGWILPSRNLIEAYASAYRSGTNRLAADSTNSAGDIPGLTLGGNYGSYGVDSQGSIVSYWSSTAFSNRDIYSLNSSSANSMQLSATRKFIGNSMRCVAK